MCEIDAPAHAGSVSSEASIAPAAPSQRKAAREPATPTRDRGTVSIIHGVRRPRTRINAAADSEKAKFGLSVVTPYSFE
jgi:hypothetical protein